MSGKLGVAAIGAEAESCVNGDRSCGVTGARSCGARGLTLDLGQEANVESVAVYAPASSGAHLSTSFEISVTLQRYDAVSCFRSPPNMQAAHAPERRIQP